MNEPYTGVAGHAEPGKLVLGPAAELGVTSFAGPSLQ